MSILPKEAHVQLQQEYYILHLIYHRNHNQHRVAVWWKHLNQVHRYLRQLLAKIQEHEATVKYRIKDRLEKEAQAVARHLSHKLFPAAYYAFNGVIALGQFVSLGMALVASLGRVHSLVQQVKNLNDVMPQASAKKIPDTVVADDLGEEVVVEESVSLPKSVSPPAKRTFDDMESIFGSKKEKKKEKKEHKDKKHKKEKKSKKKKSAIDDIFG